VRQPFPRSCFRLAGVAGFALALLLATSSQGQETSADQPPLARYVPKDNLVLYLEYDGLDAHAEAWKKTAAYKILNTTPTGVMLEEMFVQIWAKNTRAKIAGTELLALVKHVARSGFVLAFGGDVRKDKPDYVMIAFRDAYKNKEVRPLFFRFLGNMAAPNTKLQGAVRAGHKVVTGKSASGQTFSSWVEDSKKEDMVFVFPSPESADVILETLDGKRPNAVNHPARADFAKGESGFQPTGLLFIDGSAFQDPKIPPSLGLAGVKKVDYRWGFHENALMTITRISTSGPRTGLLALLDGPSFDKGKLPPIPESVTGFTVASLDLKTTIEKLTALAKTFSPDAENQFNQAIDSFKAKTKLRLKEDVLAHLGPKVAWYVLPAKSGAAPASPGLPNMMSMMMASAGMGQIPKLAIVFDIDDPVAFGKVLDEAMAAANREFKAQASKAAGEDAQPKGGRNRGSGSPSFEFRLMPGDTKTFVLQIPPDLASQFPATLRPTIRVGPKQVVIAVSADVARMALELKGTWAPPTELSGAFQGLPSNLKVLDVRDPRETLPGILSTLPGKIQTGINTAMAMASGAPIPGGGLAGVPGNPGSPNRGGQPQVPMAGVPGASGSAGGSGDSSRPMVPMAPGSTGGSGGSGGQQAMLRPGAAGAAGNSPGGAAAFTFQIDASKVPSADSIKSLLFPSIFTIEAKDEEIQITTRESFPELPDPGMVGGLALVLPAIQAARNAARGGAAPGPGGAAPGVFPPPVGGARPNAPGLPAGGPSGTQGPGKPGANAGKPN
jgi:hypothetical protein